MRWAFVGALVGAQLAVVLLYGWLGYSGSIGILSVLVIALSAEAVVRICLRKFGRGTIRMNLARCVHCGYCLTGLGAEGRCPECGKKFSLAAIQEVWRRYLRVVGLET